MENLASAHVALSEDDQRRIGEALERIPVQGARYPAHLQQTVGK